VTLVAVLELLRQRFGQDVAQSSEFRGNDRLIVGADRVFAVLQTMKSECGFDMLVELTAVDYLQYPNARDRYGVIYVIRNLTTGIQLVVKTHVNDPDPKLPSVCALWKGADWMEREVFDMYGIVFEGHPDLRRILMPEEFTAYPLRKDYPMRGRGERHNFPVITRAES
jgi:NADH-quinone oxidoreductase subunit C